MWADIKIKTGNAKNGVASSVNLTLHIDLILKTLKQREKSDRLQWLQTKKLHMERHYEGSHILFLESTTQSMSIQICISFFTNYSGSNICNLVWSWIHIRKVTADT